MKCIQCESELSESEVMIPLEGELFRFKVLKCKNGHTFLSISDLMGYEKVDTEKLRLRRNLSMSGNALIVRIPKDMAVELGLDKSSEVNLWVRDKKSFVVEKQNRRNR